MVNGAGETRTITSDLHTHQLAFYSADMAYVVEPGDITLMLGTSSDNLPLHHTITLTGEVTPVREKLFFTNTADNHCRAW